MHHSIFFIRLTGLNYCNCNAYIILNFETIHNFAVCKQSVNLNNTARQKYDTYINEAFVMVTPLYGTLFSLGIPPIAMCPQSSKISCKVGELLLRNDLYSQSVCSLHIVVIVSSSLKLFATSQNTGEDISSNARTLSPNPLQQFIRRCESFSAEN